MAGPLDTNRFQGDLGNAALVPEKTYGSPITGTHPEGEEHFDSYGGQWLCVIGGTPGTWIRINTPTSGDTVGFERTIITAEAIAKYDIVTESGYKFNAKNLNHMRIFAGMATHAQPAHPAPLIIRIPEGTMTNTAWSWTPFAPLFADPDAVGGMTEAAPNGGPLGSTFGEGRLQVAVASGPDMVALVEREPLWFPPTPFPV